MTKRCLSYAKKVLVERGLVRFGEVLLRLCLVGRGWVKLFKVGWLVCLLKIGEAW